MSRRSVTLSADHYLNSGVSDEIAENLIKFYPNDDGLSYEEVLLQQASMYQSFQEREKNIRATTTRYDDINDFSHILDDEFESSRCEDIMTQEAIDEALARSLQELGEGFDDLIISEHNGTSNGSTQSTVATPSRAASMSSTQDSASMSSMQDSASMSSMQDSIDLDSMQYEELLELAEVVGVENRGVSASRISQLPTSKYRSRLFSKNKKKEENCVICQMEFSFGERLITLPCFHQYHSKCISDWLKLKKNCPICQTEVV